MLALRVFWLRFFYTQIFCIYIFLVCLLIQFWISLNFNRCHVRFTTWTQGKSIIKANIQFAIFIAFLCFLFAFHRKSARKKRLKSKYFECVQKNSYIEIEECFLCHVVYGFLMTQSILFWIWNYSYCDRIVKSILYRVGTPLFVQSCD